MYITQFSDIETAFRGINSTNYEDFFMLVKNASPIEKMLVQRLNRVISNVELSFLSIRDIKIEDSFQQKGIFSGFLDILESKGIPIMIDDIINDALDSFLMKRGYQAYVYKKYEDDIRSRYLIKNL
jgi:hypothetical protein